MKEKFLRVPVKDKETHNHEIFVREGIVKFIKSSRLRWIGHVERISKDRIQEKL